MEEVGLLVLVKGCYDQFQYDGAETGGRKSRVGLRTVPVATGTTAGSYG